MNYWSKQNMLFVELFLHKFLFSITNFDYILITNFFALIFIYS